ncbi:hypothetical protein EVAR_9225_1 [Eumeta japonica]|uniref:Uncharacterized protein n=1 Tax=Eumeta variegata TaxID=151549 RepID=A0A4C2AC48_EUMVA|nr:hypothetical protein EVAR_9225_1 [Eumeta japonica]
MTLSSASRRALKLNLKISASKPEPSLPLIIIRDVLKVNSDAQIVESLKRQNGHTTEGLDWERSRRESATADVRKPLECHPVLEVSPALYTRLIKPATYVVAAATGLGPVASSAVLALSWFRPYEADHASLRFIQSNLQRSKLATAELLVGASRRKIAVALVQEPYVGNTGELKRYPAVGSSNGWPRVPDP